MAKRRKKTKRTRNCRCRLIKQYIHYRAKKLMRAVDYGYQAWCFNRCALHRR